MKIDNKKESEWKPKILDQLTEVELPSPKAILRKYPHELSGGQQQRILIAMALITNPFLILADEPTTSLDVTVKAKILKLLGKLVQKRKTSVLFITHNLAVAKKVSKRILVIYAGQLCESAPADSFFTKPAHPYSKKLLECIPSGDQEINAIPGEVPDLIFPSSGCRFHPRCDRKLTLCSQEKSPLVNVKNDHWVCCHNPFEINGGNI